MKVYIVNKCQWLTFENVYWTETMSVWAEYEDAVNEKNRLIKNNTESWIEFDVSIHTVEEKRNV